MRMQRTEVLGSVLFAICLGALLFFIVRGNSHNESESSALREGDRVEIPNVLRDIANNEFSTSGPLLLIFFSPDCPTCQNEAPLLEHTNLSLGGKVRFVGVSRPPIVKVETFIRQTGITYNVVLDSDGYLFGSLGVRKVPSLFLIKDGILTRAFLNQSHNSLLKELQENVIANW